MGEMYHEQAKHHAEDPLHISPLPACPVGESHLSGRTVKPAVPHSPAGRLGSDSASPRRPGRPRSEQAGQAIIGATLDILLEDGASLDTLSVEAVCARAGVGKSTLYRRWPSKQALLSQVIASLSESPVPPMGESVRQDLITALQDLHEWAENTSSGRLMPHLFGQARVAPDLYAQYLGAVIEPWKAVIRDILDRGVRACVLSPRFDMQTAVAVLFGSALSLLLLPGAFDDSECSGLDWAVQTVDLIMEGAEFGGKARAGS